MCFIALMFPLFGRFVQHVGYRNKYNTYDEFEAGYEKECSRKKRENK